MKERQYNRCAMLEERRAGMALRMVVLVAALLSGLAACGRPSSSSAAVGVVERYLEAKKNNDFTAWKSALWAAQRDGSGFTPSFERPGDLGVLSLSIARVAVSDEETAQIQKRYSGSDLAKRHGWSDAFIAKNMLAVTAQYTVDYDNAKVPYADGEQHQVFYLVRGNPDSAWFIWDWGSPSQ